MLSLGFITKSFIGDTSGSGLYLNFELFDFYGDKGIILFGRFYQLSDDYLNQIVIRG